MYPSEMVDYGMEPSAVRRLYAIRMAEKGEQRAMIARLPRWWQMEIQREHKEVDKYYERPC